MKLIGQSSIWMFPIYGMAAFLSPVSRWIRKKRRWNIDGIIRLDYAPVWFFTGLLYEKLFQRM